MRHKIYRSLQIVVTEAWTVIWAEDAAPLAPTADQHVIKWDEGETGPETIVLRRRADGFGWSAKRVDDTFSGESK
ncbi:MAG: hypothetical protein WBO46_16490 [Caldilineaceae bacterium]